jgi:hypothetical protein
VFIVMRVRDSHALTAHPAVFVMEPAHAHNDEDEHEYGDANASARAARGAPC